MPFVNKPAILARAIAIIVLVSLLIVAVTAFIERITFDRLDDLNGPTEVSHISDQGRSDWNRFASGEPSRLAILLTDKDSAWLGLSHGLKSIGVPFTITDDVAEATRHTSSSCIRCFRDAPLTMLGAQRCAATWKQDGL